MFTNRNRTGRIPATAIVVGILVNPPSAWSEKGDETPRTSEGASLLFGIEPAMLDEPLVTDRPDFTESTETVPRGHLQLEGGYTFTYDREGTERRRDHGAPELLARIGLVERLELRIGWAGYSWSDSRFVTVNDDGDRVRIDDWSQGAADLTIGAKYKLLDQAAWRPHLGMIAEISVPSGSAGFGSGDIDPTIKLLWASDLNDRWAVAGNVNFAWPTDGGERFFQTAASLSLAVGLTERWGAYVEYFGFYPNAEGSDCAHSLNGGLTYLVSDNFQIDGRIGAGLNEEADDFFAGIGFAWRW